MKHLLTSAAMALVLGTGAFAQTETTTPQTDDTAQTQDQAGTQATAAQEPILADDLIGMSVYTTAGAQPEPIEGTVDPQAQQWEEIGQISDLVMTLDGNVSAVIVGVGGFLGIGERDVALALEEVNVYQSDDQDPVLVVTMTQQELEAAPAYEEGTDGTQMGTATGTAVGTQPDTDTVEMDAADTETTDTATTTVDVETVETDTDTDTAAQTQTDMDTDAAADPDYADTGTATEDQVVTPEFVESETTAESQEATQLAQDQLDEPGTAVEEDTAWDEDRAVVEDDVAATTETDTMQVETDTVQTDTMQVDEVETDTAQTETVTTEPAQTDTVATGPTTGLQRPAVQREGFAEQMITDLSVDDLTGANVYGVDDDNIGSINDLIVDAEGNISHAIISFGGFLGLGQNQVAVEFDSLQILAGDEGVFTDDLRVYINATQEQLEALPEYQQ